MTTGGALRACRRLLMAGWWPSTFMSQAPSASSTQASMQLFKHPFIEQATRRFALL